MTFIHNVLAGREAERRVQQRRRVLKAARISGDGGRTHLPCVMREISDTGARLEIHEGHMVPSRFDLAVEIDGMRAQCEVVWRSGTALGVRFRAQPVKGKPLRLQVVAPAYPAPAASLRQKPLAS